VTPTAATVTVAYLVVYLGTAESMEATVLETEATVLETPPPLVEAKVPAGNYIGTRSMHPINKIWESPQVENGTAKSEDSPVLIGAERVSDPIVAEINGFPVTIEPQPV
jgi:hypothetical protein